MLAKATLTDRLSHWVDIGSPQRLHSYREDVTGIHKFRSIHKYDMGYE